MGPKTPWRGLAVVLALAAPNLAVTPGVVRPLSLAVICATAWGRDVRHVTDAKRQAAFARYGVPWADRAHYETDHVIPRSLGGADAVDNLWPQPLAEARQLKDVLEVKLSRLVCDPRSGVSLAEARTALRGDWRVAYRHYMGRAPVLRRGR